MEAPDASTGMDVCFFMARATNPAGKPHRAVYTRWHNQLAIECVGVTVAMTRRKVVTLVSRFIQGWPSFIIILGILFTGAWMGLLAYSFVTALYPN
jgi:hypothetical protein